MKQNSFDEFCNPRDQQESSKITCIKHVSIESTENKYTGRKPNIECNYATTNLGSTRSHISNQNQLIDQNK